MPELALPTLEEIRATGERIAQLCVRTPLVRLESDDLPARVWLKFEGLQPIGAYKNRPQGAILTALSPAETAAGVYTASSGNSGLGMAYAAHRLGIAARVYSPEGIDPAKVAALEALGTEVVIVSYEQWWQIILEGGRESDPGAYVDAVRDPRALAANGMIGLEILEDLPEVDTIVAPFGGGGLVCGVGAAVHATRPQVRIVAAEVDTARPLAAALRAGRPVEVPVERSFIQAIGASTVLEPMWPLLRQVVAEATFATLAETCAAIRMIFSDAKLVAEGAAAVPLAAVRAGRVRGHNIVCVVSGGNIGAAAMSTILQGEIP